MRVLQVTPSFYPATAYGGPMQSVHGLAGGLVDNGCEVRVVTTDADGADRVLDLPKDRYIELDNGAWAWYFPRQIPHAASSGLLAHLPKAVRWADVVHLQAVYSFPTLPVLSLCRVLGRPLVWSPRGAFQRWAGSTNRGPKRFWEQLCRMLRPARIALHVTSEAEAADSMVRLPGVRVKVIPNGVVLPGEARPRERADDALAMLFVGRLHPIKGIESLLRAGARLRDAGTLKWQLTIAGAGDEAYSATLRTLIQQLKLDAQVKMVGHVDAERKEQCFRDADVVLVPSHSENFGIVVAEALARKRPVIASSGTPWQSLETEECGLWVDNEPQCLAEAIEKMATLPLAEMGERGRALVERRFSWTQIGTEMLSLYGAMGS